MKYMILVYASQRDYDAMVGKPAVGSLVGAARISRRWASSWSSLPGIWPSPGNWWTPAA